MNGHRVIRLQERSLRQGRRQPINLLSPPVFVRLLGAAEDQVSATAVGSHFVFLQVELATRDPTFI